jgi:hypothetical protein
MAPLHAGMLKAMQGPMHVIGRDASLFFMLSVTALGLWHHSQCCLHVQVNPAEVVSRVESGAYASNAAVVVQYLRALVSTDRISSYVQPAAAAASGLPGAAPAAYASAGAQQRTLGELLRDLQVRHDLLASAACSRPQGLQGFLG